MSRQTRKANRIARNIIRFTRTDWNPTYTDMIITGTPASIDTFDKANRQRLNLCLIAARADVPFDHNRLGRSIRPLEFKG